jgi:NADP-dependent 3-hydroxy acid dehydrogenase YdfG
MLPPSTSAPGKRRRGLQLLGWILLIGSFPVWCALFVAPFLPLPPAQRVLVAGAFAVAGEAMFWTGGALLGAAVVARFRKPKVRTGKSFAGTRAAVLGATGGLGSAIVDALRREGASVLAMARDAGRLEALGATRPGLGLAQVDVTSEASLASAAAAVDDLDLLVVATGADVRKPLAEHSAAEIQLLLDTNLGGAVLAVRAFADHLQDGGTIVLLGGFGDGRLGLPFYSVDVASRAGISAFAQAMNREFALGHRDLRVCYACPAPADTEAERPNAELWREMGTPLAAPEKVADFVLVTALRRQATAVMGWRNRLISRVNGMSPWLADVVGLRAAGVTLRTANGAPAAGDSQIVDEQH